ncbi:MAG: D-glycero-alpha-D-manno-heptose-1,7-bisphosphate 7-phosphatase [Bacteroidales bacterium]
MNELKRISVLLNSEVSPALFLDRDGVINRRIEGGYVKFANEFEFLPDVPQALAILNRFFSPVIIVTNQQGIGKGLMSEEQLKAVHDQMLKELGRHGARIDRIYYCPALESSGDKCRKPSPGMAWKARKDFVKLNLNRSVMVGDSLSDMFFGRKVGMFNVFIGPPETARKYVGLIHLSFPALIDFAHFISNLPSWRKENTLSV